MKWHERVKRALSVRGYTYRDVADALGGISVGAVGHKLRGYRPTTVEELHVISELCGVSASELLGQPCVTLDDPMDQELLGLIRQISPESKRRLRGIAQNLLDK